MGGSQAKQLPTGSNKTVAGDGKVRPGEVWRNFFSFVIYFSPERTGNHFRRPSAVGCRLGSGAGREDNFQLGLGNLLLLLLLRRRLRIVCGSQGGLKLLLPPPPTTTSSPFVSSSFSFDQKTREPLGRATFHNVLIVSLGQQQVAPCKRLAANKPPSGRF